MHQRKERKAREQKFYIERFNVHILPFGTKNCLPKDISDKSKMMSPKPDFLTLLMHAYL